MMMIIARGISLGPWNVLNSYLRLLNITPKKEIYVLPKTRIKKSIIVALVTFWISKVIMYGTISVSDNKATNVDNEETIQIE